MPVMDGVEAARLIREQMPAVRVVMLTVSEADEHVFDAIQLRGVSGYLLKDLRPEHLYDMLRAADARRDPSVPGDRGAAARPSSASADCARHRAHQRRARRASLTPPRDRDPAARRGRA